MPYPPNSLIDPNQISPRKYLKALWLWIAFLCGTLVGDLARAQVAGAIEV